MDENNGNSFINNDNKNEEANVPVKEQKESMQHNADNIRNFTMDQKGSIKENDLHVGHGGTAAVATGSKTFVVLGWISAALAAFISPLFAIAGIIFGVLVNRQVKGKGNALIITNIVLAAINIVFGLFLVATMRRMMTGY